MRLSRLYLTLFVAKQLPQVTLAKLNRDDTHQIFCFRRKQRTKPVSEAQTPVPEGSYAIVSVGESGEVIARAGTLQVVLVDSGFLHGPKSVRRRAYFARLSVLMSITQAQDGFSAWRRNSHLCEA